MTRFKWAVLACSTVVALVAVIVPGANSASSPGLKITSVFKSSNPGPIAASQAAKCPKGYSVVGGGYESTGDFDVHDAGRLTNRKWVVTVSPATKAKESAKRGTFLGAEAICAKGTG